jgi:hypothetical protein
MSDLYSIAVVGPMLESEMFDFLESSGFNKRVHQYILHYWERFTKDLTPEQLDEVREWWGPGWPAHYPREVRGLRQDFYDTASKEARQAISSLISYGLG